MSDQYEPVWGDPQPGDPPICEDCRDLYMDGIFCSKHFKEHGEEMGRLNHRAYADVLERLEPSMPDNAFYMKYYNSWKAIQEISDEE